MSHLVWAARYANEHPPDIIVFAGDVYDMPSLSAYDKPGSHAAEGRRVAADLDAGHAGVELFATHLEVDCPIHVLLGNHEDRLLRAVREDARLEGLIGEDSFAFKQHGWKVHEYQRAVQLVPGIWFAHYFNPGADGTTTGRPPTTKQKATLLLPRLRRSFVCGHTPGYSHHVMGPYGKMGRDCGVVAGSFYQHDMKYPGPNGGGEWRGIVMLNDCHRGEFEPLPISMRYLKEKYGRFK